MKTYRMAAMPASSMLSAAALAEGETAQDRPPNAIIVTGVKTGDFGLRVSYRFGGTSR